MKYIGRTGIRAGLSRFGLSRDRQECLSYTFDEAGRRFAVSDHDDLLHLFALRLQNAARQPQSLGGVGVIRTDLRDRELCQRQFFRTVVKEHNAEGIARILRANQMCQCECDFFRRRKTIFSIQNHRMRAIQHDHGSA